MHYHIRSPKLQRVILAGDFNCHVPWISQLKLRPRDREFIVFILNNGLLTANSEFPTCKHQGRFTTNDYTLYRDCQVNNWVVDVAEETLLDHRYVIFSIDLSSSAELDLNTYSTTNYNRIQEEISATQVFQIPYNSQENTIQNASAITAWLSHLVHTNTNTSTTYSQSHWWTPELDKMRRELKALNLKMCHGAHPDLRGTAKERRKSYRKAIRVAKKMVWRKFITIERPWDKPYKICVKTKVKQQVLIPDHQLLHEKFVAPAGGSPDASDSISSSHHHDIQTADSDLKEEDEFLVNAFPDLDEEDKILVDADTIADLLKKSSNRTTLGADGISYKLLKILNKSQHSVCSIPHGVESWQSHMDT